MADIRTRAMEQQLLPPSPTTQIHHPHQLNQLQRSTSAKSDQDGMYSGAMDTGSSLTQDWIQPPADYNNLTSLGFDGMFQFNGQPDPFPIDHTEFASNDFGFAPGMAGPVSSMFESNSNSALVAGGSLENIATAGVLDNNGFHGSNSSNGDSSMGLGLSHTHMGNSNNGQDANLGVGSSDNTLLEQGGPVNLSLALKPHYMKSLKASGATALPSSSAATEHRQQQLQQQLQQDQQSQQQHQHQQASASYHDQGFNTTQMDLNPPESGLSLFSAAPIASSQQHTPMMFQPQRLGQEQPNIQAQQQSQQQQPFSFPQQTLQQQQPSTQLEDDVMSQHNSFGHSRTLSISGVTHQQQFEDMLFHQQQQQLNHDIKGHFRHSSSPNLSEIIKQEQPPLRSQRQQPHLHQHQESLQLSHQQQQRQPIQPSSIHPFSTAPALNSKVSIAPARTLTKRPSDLHVDISGRSSSFRLSGDVRNGDFRFGSDGRDPADNVSAPLSPSTSSMTAPLTPAFFSPAFGEALGSPGSVLYQNSPFILTSQDRNRVSIQTDTSMGSFMDMQASSASSPSSLGSLGEAGHRMFRGSADSMQLPVETVTPMDIACNFNEISGDLNFMEKQNLTSVSAASALQHRDSFCHSPDHIDPHSVEVKPSYFATTYQEEQTHIKMEVVSTPEIDHDYDTPRSIFRDGSATDAPATPTGSTNGNAPPLSKIARKRRSNEGVSYSPSASSPSSSSSPPRPTRSRTISTTSSLVDEKEEPADSPKLSFYGPAASLKPIMLTQDLKPPSDKTMRTNIKRFLASKTPAQGGEKSVLILTSKVAQKSYGTEKRFLCPPPTTMLLGSNWWSAPFPNQSSDEDPVPTPPKMIISICGEAGSQQGVIDWTTTKDDNVTPIITGKCVSKQLYINDADEKRKKVEVLVKFMMAGDIELGTFASRPIKVISKPSKKRQSIKNMELCIHHGTTISLFNRIRSQTVSTKYLGVSTTTQASAHAPWNYGSNNLKDWPNLDPSPESSSNPVNTDGGTCFVARTGGWDPFVVWIVSPGQTRTESLQEHMERHPGFPPPPAIAINSPPESAPQTPIHYNQPIVLQCLSTGLVSPVMVIRKVDKGSMVLGGGSTGHSSAEYDQEAIGDPVSQLHKVAFQITGQATPAGTFSHGRLQQGTYLACLGDVVGMQRANEGKRYLPDPKATSSPTADASPTGPFSMDIVPEIPESNVPEGLMSAWSAANDKAMESGPCASEKSIVTTADGQRFERRRRVSSVVIKSMGSATKAVPKSKRRGNSMSVTQAEAQRIRASALAANNHCQHNPIQAFAGSNGADVKEKSTKESAKVLALQQQRRHSSIWTEDVTDAAVWTIVGTDCAQYNFCTPGGSESMALPRSPVTSVPKVLEICLSGQTVGTRASAGPIYINNATSTAPHSSHGKGHGKGSRGTDSHGSSNGHHHHHDGSHSRNGSGVFGASNMSARLMSFKGHGFSRDLSVWFGTIKAPVTEYQSPDSLVVQIPEEVSLGSSFYFTKDDDEDAEGDDDDDEDSTTANGGRDESDNKQHHRSTGSEERFRRKRVKSLFESDCVPILLVRSDGVIYRSGHSIALG
ncbi:hypothetical protein BGZ80_010658 [Entomortierella chlamydospora]|uniref:LAG1-DNAbind-domain-containing protein n=1 Tax=Entomortierella chlamydospora TaxID=101097 RepID=A0A9P6SZL1_9FUNG|nr:hypothetical protein BGZ80_010658 [Entomortierella chlamydospora]